MSRHLPPRWMERLLERRLPLANRDAILGDLREEYGSVRRGALGSLTSQPWYMWQVLVIGTRYSIGRDHLGSGVVGDMRLAARQLTRQPGFSIVVTAALALGVGLNAAVMSIARAVFVTPLPFPHHERLAIISNDFTGSSTNGFGVSFPNMQTVARQQQTLEEFALFLDWQNVNLSGADQAYRLAANFVTPNYFTMLGLETSIGRPIEARDDRLGDPARVAVLSYGAWQRMFGGQPEVLGRSVLLNGQPFQIVGVTQPQSVDLRLRADTDSDIFLPLLTAPALLGFEFVENRGLRVLSALIRVRQGLDVAAARSDLLSISEYLASEHPESNEGWTYATEPVDEAFFEEVRVPITVLLAGAGLVLLLVSVNLTNLFLIRGNGRVRELAVRRALGAGRGRLLRQLLTESLFLSVLGGAIGVLVAAWTLNALARTELLQPPRFADATLGWVVIALSFVMTFCVGIVFAVFPASQLIRSPTEKSWGAGRLTEGRNRVRARDALVACEVALAFTVLVVAGLMLHSFSRLRSTSVGFDTDNLVAVRLDLRGERYESTDSRLNAASALHDRIADSPGVEAGFIWSPNRLGHGNWVNLLTREGRWEQFPEERFEASRHHVFPGTLGQLGIQIIRGRDFTDADGTGGVRVAIISESLAQELFREEDPIGRRMDATENGEIVQIEVIGVARDARHRTRLIDPFGAQPDIYHPYRQLPERYLSLVARIDPGVDAASVVGTMRDAVAEVDPSLPLYDVTTMEDQLREEEGRSQLAAVLVALYAALAVIIAALGVHGVLAHAVRRRTREIGVRIALGATARAVIRGVVGGGMQAVAVGIAVGSLGALALSRMVSSALYGVRPWNPWIFAGVTGLLIAVALGASYIPARRAARVDPTVALREE